MGKIIISSLFFILISCQNYELHVHDRHSLSYDVLKNYIKDKQIYSLILFDYHHDIADDTRNTHNLNEYISWPTDNPESSSWAGNLLAQNKLNKLYWISDQDLKLPNKKSREAWLKRSISKLPYSIAQEMENKIDIIDYNDLIKTDFNEKIIVSIDLDILAHHKGENPLSFLDNMLSWINQTNPGLITVALSSSYQNNAEESFKYLEHLIKSSKLKKYSLYLESDNNNRPESYDEIKAWKLWDLDYAAFRKPPYLFWHDPWLWIYASKTVRKSFLGRDVKPGNVYAEDILTVWNNNEFEKIENEFTISKRKEFIDTVRNQISDYWDTNMDFNQGDFYQCLNPSPIKRGVAVRILGDNIDRGCLSLYTGVSDMNSAIKYCSLMACNDPRYSPVLEGEKNSLSLELSIFGEWHSMNNADDFIPGFHSIKVIDDKDVTILQSSVAVQRRYQKEDVIKTILKKAGIDYSRKESKELKWEKAVTLWHAEPFIID